MDFKMAFYPIIESLWIFLFEADFRNDEMIISWFVTWFVVEQGKNRVKIIGIQKQKEKALGH